MLAQVTTGTSTTNVSARSRHGRRLSSDRPGRGPSIPTAVLFGTLAWLAAATGCRDQGSGGPDSKQAEETRTNRSVAGKEAQEGASNRPAWWETMDNSGQATLPRRAADPARALEQDLATALDAIRKGRLRLAEAALRRALEAAPDDVRAHRGLVVVLNTLGRRWESWPHAMALIKQGQFAVEDLLFLANYDEWYENEPLLRRAFEAEPNNEFVWLGLARIDRHNNRVDAARERLERVVKTNPEVLEAQAQLGRLLLDQRDDAALMRWREALPASADRHPEIWFVRGYWAQRHGQIEAAARCFWEAARLEPVHQRSHYQLALMLTRLGEAKLAKGFMDRARMLADLGTECHPIFLKGPDLVRMQRIIELEIGLGHLWEAWAWSVATADLARREGRPDNELELRRDRLKRRIDAERPPRVVHSSRIAERVSLRSRYPLPQWPEEAVERAPAKSADPQTLRFDDMAAQVGIDFTYYDSAKDRPDGIQIMDGTGGGVAVLDYDGDGWPDLYFSQGGRWLGEAPSPTHADKLFRNLGNGRFRDVTEAAGIDERGFSQGCTSGDYNNDGFPDLFVANIGQNKLYLNNGDGTFSPVVWPMDPQPLMWSTSCAIVDLNRDGLPDIFDVYYVTGDDVYTRRCGPPEKRTSCGPVDFDPVANRMFLNQGDGSWREATRDSGLGKLLGKGLGLLIADFERDGNLEIFIANDAVANFYLKSDGTAAGGVPKWRDEGLLRGLALNRDGRAEACMGIAADDINRDGRVDLYVTNYYEESNTLYRQEAGPLFIDVTHEADLHGPTFRLLGWGTQFLDANLDGDPDLIMTNGHPEDHRDRGIPLQMPPQVFVNLGNGRYREIERNAAGSYFADEYLGRGMALIDWNRDGLEDVAVSNIGAPASLATNRTPSTGHFLALRLRGRSCSRDAYGAVVTILYGDGKTRIRQLCAGSGFHACNDRTLIFGLADADAVRKMEVVWPDGSRQAFENLRADQEWIVIQGRPDVVALPAVSRGE